MDNNYVALYKNGKYYVGIINEENYFFEKDVRKLLPVVLKSDSCTNNFLDKILNVGYFEYEHEFRVYDKSNESYLEISIPVFAKKIGELEQTKKKYTLKIPTNDMINNANNIQKRIITEIENVKSRDDIEKINNIFLDGAAIVYITDDNFEDIERAIKFTSKVILWTNGTDYIIGCIDNVKNDDLELYIPERIKGYVLGKKAKNIQKMENVMNKRIIIKTF